MGLFDLCSMALKLLGVVLMLSIVIKGLMSWLTERKKKSGLIGNVLRYLHMYGFFPEKELHGDRPNEAVGNSYMKYPLSWQINSVFIVIP